MKIFKSPVIKKVVAEIVKGQVVLEFVEVNCFGIKQYKVCNNGKEIKKSFNLDYITSYFVSHAVAHF
jgi:hypothetical protein